MSKSQEDGANPTFSCRLPNQSGLIKMGHGSGGKMTADLIESVFLPRLGKDIRNHLDDAAVLDFLGGRLAFSTDAYVVSPVFFPGGNIGSLAVHGTINDLAMRGAKPMYMAASFILEEGLEQTKLEKIIESFGKACEDAEVKFVAADTKVVNKGACDQLFITTTGIGLIDFGLRLGADQAAAGDCIIVSGDIGRHGMAIMSCRSGLDLETDIESDSASLHRIVAKLLNLDEASSIKCMRDITRGGLATVLNEIAAASAVGINVSENQIPIHNQVGAICEILGLDPLYVACEGRFVLIADKAAANIIVDLLKMETGNNAAIIGEIVESHPGRVVVSTMIGGNRILDKLAGEQLPRIC